MKIACYNIWYPNIDIRADQLMAEINNTDADIIGLQEVPLAFYKRLIENVKYPHHAYASYADECDEDDEQGLVFLSKHNLSEQFSLCESEEYGKSIAHNAIFEVNGIKYSVTNVHLPWDSALAKEKQIVAIDRFIHSQRDKVNFFILLGDFNCNLQSSVHNYLLGNQTLLGCEANPYWNDLASVHAALNGYNNVPTLDFVNNPRWRGKNTNYIPEVFDRIYIMDSYNWDYEFELCDVRVFGKEVSSITGYAPSDHYGLLVDVNFTVPIVCN